MNNIEIYRECSELDETSIKKNSGIRMLGGILCFKTIYDGMGKMLSANDIESIFNLPKEALDHRIENHILCSIIYIFKNILHSKASPFKLFKDLTLCLFSL